MTASPFFIRISPDHLLVTLESGELPNTSLQPRSGDDLRRMLSDKGVVHGRDDAAIARAGACIDNNQPLLEPLALAAGVAPIAGVRGMQPQFAVHTRSVASEDEEGQPRQIEITLTPLVRPGDILAEIAAMVRSQSGTDVFGEEIPAPPIADFQLQPGDLVQFDEGSQRIVACASGYPVLASTRKGGIEVLRLNIAKAVRVTEDRMQAILDLRPEPPCHDLPDPATIESILDEERISFGRLPLAIEQCLRRVEDEQMPQEQVIALGTLPVNGKDAWLRFAMEIGPLPGKVLGNGQIDFRERNMFVGVDKDQLIAVRIPPTPGIPGIDLFGEPVAQTPGKDITVRVSDDTSYDESTGEVRATRAGVLSMVSEGTVKVCSRQVIAQDIDYLVGNVFSRDALEIKGSIKPRFKISALGDILVGGSVEKAQLRAGGNVIVQGGVIGDDASIRAHGDIDLKFVEHGRAIAGGSIILRKSAYHCRLHAEGNLHCEPSSRVIASQLVAGGTISAGTVGNDQAGPALLAAAVNPGQLQVFYDLQRTIVAESEAVLELRIRFGSDSESEELAELVESLEEHERLFGRLNLILPDERSCADHGLSRAMACAIIIQGKVFAGTEIRIGNRRRVLEETMSGVRFHLQDPAVLVDLTAKNGIAVSPLKK